IESKAGDLCHGGVCTRHQCCETAPPMCNSIGCPNGYTPIDNACEVECSNGECGVDQCCKVVCAGYACPNNYTPIQDADEVLCTHGICTTVQCCDRHQNAGARCADYTCPSGTEPRANAQQDMCAGAHGCQPEQCCGSTDRTSPPPPPPSPSGYHRMDGVDNVECFGDEYEKDECCERDENLPEGPDYDYCSSYLCPSETHRPIEKADQKRCAVVDVLFPTPAPFCDDGSYQYHYYDDAMISDDDGDDDGDVVVVGGGPR
ncbi:unnamed protein product, partial [Pylaiella littoralis]